jgi:hypothetical protein
MFVAFSGGIDGALSKFKKKPNPNSTELIASRNYAKGEIQKEYILLSKINFLTEYDSSTYDYCYKGQKDWKIMDAFNHRCDFRITKYYGFIGDFRSNMKSIEQEIAKLQWLNPNDTSKSIGYNIDNNYEDYVASEISNDTNYNYQPSYGAGEIANGYLKNNIVMDITYTNKESEVISWLDSAQYNFKSFPFYEDSNFVDIQSVFTKITKDNPHVLAISLEKNYYEN